MSSPWESGVHSLRAGGGGNDTSIIFKNAGAEQVPEFGVMIPSGWDSTRKCLALKAADAFREVVLFQNVGGQVGVGKYGRCICVSGTIFYAKYASSGSVGDSYGNDDDPDTLIKDRPGAVLIADTSSDDIGIFVCPAPFVCSGKAMGDGDGTVSVKLSTASGSSLTAVGTAFTVTCPPAE